MNKYCDKHGQLQPCVECLSGYAAMGGSFVVKQATPPDELIKQLMDSRVPKTEREHAAAAEIDSLRQRLAAAEAMNKKLLDERIIDRNLYYERGCEQGKLYIQEMLKEALGI